MQTTKGGSVRPKKNFYTQEGENVKRYIWVADLVKGMDILDAGCGSGYGTHYLSQFTKTIVGVDTDKDALEIARRTYPNVRCEFGDVEDLHFSDKSFDAVISFEVIEHLRNPHRYLLELKRIAKDFAILSTPSLEHKRLLYERGLCRNLHHMHEYLVPELEVLLSGYFSQLDSYALFTDVPGASRADSLVYASKIPSEIRRFIPKLIKQWWAQKKGLTMATSWQDWKVELKTPDEFTSGNYPTQIWVCKIG
jgi:SAM-dependent methyltransferase